MRQHQRLLALATILMSTCFSSAQAHLLNKVSGLNMPESALVAKDGQVYISEIGEFGKDGDGQIRVFTTAGELKVFSKGLDDPKGLAMIGPDLYVADKQRIVKISPDGVSKVWVQANDFPQPPQFLNDLVADAQGNLYVSDSGDLKGNGGAIFKINSQAKVSTLIDAKKDPRIAAPNGLLMGNTANCIMILDFASGGFYRYDMKKDELLEIASGLGGGDGLVQTPSGVYYTSDWKNGKVYQVIPSKTAGGKATVSLYHEGLAAAADMDLSADGKILYVPDMKAGELHLLMVH